jgi:molybdopterin/thiamine biosynthesis adenylyltransferase/nitroreductase
MTESEETIDTGPDPAAAGISGDGANGGSGADRTSGIAADPAPFFAEMLSRNAEIVTEQEQGALGALSILIAGCGSVGGSAIEPLVRAGLGGLVLADPETYELNNINRQVCTLADVGRLKVDVHADRAKSINPHVRVRKMPDGLTAENIDSALEEVSIVFDGVDPSPGPLWIKYLLHRYAARRGIPVLSGADLGGQATLYVFDYRRDSRPFYGKANVAAMREGRQFDALRPWIGIRNLPTDFGPVIAGRSAGGAPWPQVSYTTATLGALATRAVIDVALDREVPHVIRPDLHMLLRSPRERWAWRLRRPRALVVGGGRLAVQRAISSLAPSPPAEGPALPEGLRPVLEAMRQAPSPHNSQPWSLTVTADGRIRVGWDRLRHLQIADPKAQHLCHALGGAIEAANAVAEIAFTPTEGREPFAPDWHAGDIGVERIRESEYQAMTGALTRRSTNRGAYSTYPVDAGLLEVFTALAERHGTRVLPLTDHGSIGRLAELCSESAASQLRQRPYLDELLEWVRFSERELDWDEDGLPADALGLNPTAKAFLRGLKVSPRLRRNASTTRLAEAMARQATQNVRQSGALLLLAVDESAPRAWVDAGRAMMAIWLAATRAGLALQPVNFPLDVPGAGDSLMAAFGADQGGTPVLLLRTGRPLGPAPPTLRLPMARIVELETAPA